MWKVFASLFNRARMALVCRRKTLARWQCSPAGRLIAAFLAAQAGAAQAQVVADGQTATTVERSGSTTQVNTATVVGNTGFNSFSQFSVAGQHTVNLHLPGQAANLINIVREERSVIDGTVNSIRNGAIGGNVFFLNPYGFMVGASGRFNVGSLSLQTPTANFVQGFFSAPGTPDAQRTADALAGTAPVNPDATIDMRGTVQAIGDVRLSAGALVVGGQIYSGARFVVQAPDFSDVVNARGLASSTGVERRGGQVFLTAAGDLAVSGTVNTPGTAGEAGGSIVLRAGRDIDVLAGALLAARGEGDRSDGGTVDVFAQRNASFSGGTIDAGAGAGGQGGAIEFSAKEKVTLAGGRFTAAAPGGQAGRLLVDPLNIDVSALYTSDIDATLAASDSIVVADNVVLSTRQVAAGTTPDASLLDSTPSTGDSYDLTMTAPVIRVGNDVKIVSFATDGHDAGDITLRATGATSSTSITIGTATLDAGVRPAADGSVGRAGSITLQALSQPAGSLLGYRQGDATVTLNGAILNARDIDISARTELRNVWTNGQAGLDSLTDPDAALLPSLDNQGSEFLSALTGATLVHSQLVARSVVAVNADSKLTATDKLSLRAENLTDTTAKQTDSGAGLPVAVGAMYVRNAPTAEVTVASGAEIDTRDLALRAHNDATIDAEVGGSRDGTGAIAVGVTRADVTATARVQQGASLRVSGDLSVAATSVTSFKNSTSSTTRAVDGQALGSAAVAISSHDVATTAELNADVGVGGVVPVNVSVVSLAESTENTTTAEAKAGEPVPALQLAGQSLEAQTPTDGGQQLQQKLQGDKALDDKIQPTKPDTGSKWLTVGGAVAYSDSTVASKASVGAGAQVSASGKLLVAAQTKADQTGTQAQAEAQSEASKNDPQQPTAKLVVGAGVAIGDYTHDADAYIGVGAELTARQIGVDAKVSLPRKETPVDKLTDGQWDSWDAVSEKLDFVSDPAKLVDPFEYANGGASAESSSENVGLAGAVSLQFYNGNARAVVDRLAVLKLLDAAATGNWTQSFTMPPASGSTTADTRSFSFDRTATLQATQDAELWFFTGKLGNLAAGKFSLGGAYNLVHNTGTTAALLREGAQLRGSAGDTAAAGDFGVFATTTDRLVAVSAGGGRGESFGLTGQFAMTTLDRHTLAAVDDEATVRAGTVAVQAKQDVVSWAVGGAVSTAQTAAVGLGAALNDGQAQVRAAIADVDTELGMTSDPDLSVTGEVVTGHLGVDSDAKGRLQAVALAGAVAGPSNGPIDWLGERVKSLLGGEDAQGTPEKGKAETVTEAKPESAAKADKADKAKPKFEFTLAGAGSAAVNLADVDAKAELVGAHVTQTGAADADLLVRAVNSTNVVSAAGAAALTTGGQGKSNVGVAGAVAVNLLSGGALARIGGNSVVTDADTVQVQALKAGEHLSLGVGLNVNAGATQSSWQGTGSVSVTLSTDEVDDEGRSKDRVLAAIDGSAVGFDAASAARDLDVTAYNKMKLGTGAGALNAMGKNAVGGAVTYSELTSTTEARIGTAGAGSTIDDAGTVEVTALNAMKIAAGAAMATASTASGGIALSGSVVINKVTDRTAASITDSTVRSTGDTARTDRVAVTAKDVAADATLDTLISERSGSIAYDHSATGARALAGNSDATATEATKLEAAPDANSIVAVAGTLAVVPNGSTANASVNYNRIRNTLSATVDDSGITLAGGASLVVDAQANSNILGIAVGLSLGDKFNASGSVAISEIDNTVTARVRGVNQDAVAAAQLPRLAVAAGDSSRIDTIAGQVSGSLGGTAIGAAVAYAAIDNTVQAQLDDAAVRGNQSTTVDADSDARIRNIAVAGGGAAKFAFAGSVGLNFIDNTTTASVDGSTVAQRGDAAGDVFRVEATDTSKISALSGALAGAGQGGIGLAFSLNKIGSFDAAEPDHATNATVTGSEVTGGDDARVSAQSDTGIDAIGAAFSGGGSFAVSGSFAINHIAAKTSGAVAGSRFDGNETVLAIEALDKSRIRSISGGVAGGGTAAVGAGMAFNRIANTVDASLSGLGSGAHQVRSLTVTADTFQEIDALTLGAAVSADLGVGASLAVNLIGDQVMARIDGGAQVVAQNDVGVVADSDEAITNVAGSLGVGVKAAGIGASVSVNRIDGSTEAKIDGAGTQVSALGQHRVGDADLKVNSGTLSADVAVTGGALSKRKEALADFGLAELDVRQQTETVHGVAVNASSTHSIESAGANMAGGPLAGVGAVVNTNLVGGTTRALVSQASLNAAPGADAAQQASVKASDHAAASSILGSLAFGATGLGITADVTVFSRETAARVTDADFHAAGDAAIGAQSSQTARSFAVGGSVGGVGLQGTGSVASFNSLTEASLSGGTAKVGALDVDARHASRVLQTAGGLAAGGAAAGIGASVALDASTTRAKIDGATVDTAGAVTVEAATRTEVDVLAVAGALSGSFGFAGNAAVVVTNNTTEAQVLSSSIGSRAVGGTQAASLTVDAFDSVGITALGGSASLGGGLGLAAGASVVKAENTNSAQVTNSTVTTSGTTAVTARTERELAAGAAALGAGPIGLAGTAAVVLSGSSSSEADEQVDSKGGTLSEIDGLLGKATLNNNGGSGDQTVSDRTGSVTMSSTDVTALNAGSAVAIRGQATAVAPTSTTAAVSGGSVQAKGVQVSATEANAASTDAGAASLGALGFGAAVAVTEIRSTVNARIGGGAQVSAGSDGVAVLASSGALDANDPTTRAAAHQGAGGLIAAGAAIARANNLSTVTAEVADAGTTLNVIDGDASIDATANGKGEAEAVGLSVGLVGVGVSLATVTSDQTSSAQLGSPVTGAVSGRLRVGAYGNEVLTAKAAAGAGGVAAGAAAVARNVDTSTTQASVATANADTPFTAGRVEVDARHVVTVDGTVDTMSAGVVGGSGGEFSSTVGTTTTAGFADGAIVRAREIAVNAEGVAIKPERAGFNLQAGAGGAIGVSAAGSTTTLTLDTEAYVGREAQLIGTGTRTDPGDFRIGAHGEVRARDAVNLDAGGAIAVADAESKITATMHTDVTVREGASVSAQGDLSLGAWSSGDVGTHAYGKTYGLAGAPVGRSTATLEGHDAVSLSDGVVLFSLGDTTLSAGSSIDGKPSTLSADARTDLFNKTAFPVVTLPIADATAVGTSLVDVPAGAQVNAVNNVNLFADTPHTSAVGVGVGKDLYREVLAAIANAFSWLFGGGHVSLDIRTGSADARGTGTVNVDGAVRAGVQNKLHLVFNQDGTMTVPEALRDQLQPKMENLYSNLMELRATYLAKLTVVVAGSVEELALQAEVDRITQELVDLKLVVPESLVPTANVLQSFITVPDLLARGGDINVRANDLKGTGVLSAPNDAEIRIVNNTSAYLRVNELTIPGNLGGHINVNGVDKRGVSELGPNAQFSGFVTGAGTTPLIHVQNTYVPPDDGDIRAPDLIVQGDVSNLDGAVVVQNAVGKIVVRDNPRTHAVANIEGSSIDISGGGDVVLGYVDGFRHVGGQPEGQVRDLPRFEAGSANQDSSNDVRDGNGSIIGANVFVSGRYLNINGTIRAGQPDWTLDLSGIEPEILKAQQAWKDGGSNPAQAVAVLWERDNTNGRPQVSFNAATNRIEVENIRVQGGRMVLTGEILSTGGGKLEALDGFGHIAIANPTSYAVDLKGLDTGSGAEGRITLIDSGYLVTLADGTRVPRMSVYERLGSGADQTMTLTTFVRDPQTRKLVPIEDPQDLGAGRSGSAVRYDPVTGQKYMWVHSKLTGQTQTTSTANGAWLFWLQPVDFGATTTPVVASDSTTQFTPAEGQRGPSQTAPYNYERVTTDNWSRVTSDVLGCGFLCSDLFQLKTTTTTATRLVQNIHSIKADKQIPIEFIGHDRGSIDVSSKGDVVLSAGAVRNSSGGTTVSSSEGAIRGESNRGIVGGVDVTLSARDGIGGASATDALQVDVNGGLLTAGSGAGDVRLRERSGTAVYGRLDAGQVLSLRSEGAVEGPAAVLAGQRIEVDAARGVGADAPITLERGEAGVSVGAAGDISLRHAGDLHADRIESLGGDVTVAIGGQLIDANRNEQRDERTIAQLEDTWKRARVVDGSPEAAQSAAEAIDNYRRARERDYLAFWRAREFDADNPPVAYQASAAETLMFSRNHWTPKQVSAYLAERQALWDSFRDTTYDPGYRYAVSEAERAAVTQGIGWTRQELTGGLAPALVDKQVTSTETRVEQANLAGRNITVTAGRGVGALKESFTLREGAPFDDSHRLALLAAEPDDVGVDNDAKTLTVLQRDDVDFQASGNINVTTARHAYLGGQADLNLDAVTAGEALRIKGAGSLLSAERATSGLGAGGNVVLEAGSGSIGSTGAPIQLALAQPGGATLTARAQGDIVLSATGALPIGNVFSAQGTAHLTATGAIVDALGDARPKVDAASVVLRGTAIGSSGEALDVQTQRDGTVRAEATDGGIWLADSSETARLADLRATGTVSVAATGDIVAGSVRGSGIVLTSLEGGIGADAGTAGPHLVTTLADGSVSVRAAADIGSSGHALRTQVGRIDAVSAGGGVFVDEADDLVLTVTAAQTVSARVGGDATLDSVVADSLELHAGGAARVAEARLGSRFDLSATQLDAQLTQVGGAAGGFSGALGGPAGTQADGISARIDTDSPLTLARLDGVTVRLDTTAPRLLLHTGWIGHADISVPGTGLLIDTLRPQAADVQLYAPSQRYSFSIAGNEVVTDAFVVGKRDSHTTRSPQGRDVTVVDSAARFFVIPKLPQPAGTPVLQQRERPSPLAVGALRFDDEDDADDAAPPRAPAAGASK